MMSKRLRTWVLATDAAHARLFIYDDVAGEMHVAALGGLPPPEDRLQPHTEKSDHPGRSFGSSGDGVRHALESHSDYRKLEKRKFAVAVADAINRASLAKEFDRLVLVAPARSIGELRQHLSDQVQSGMQVIAKDLTKAPAGRIWEEVEESVRRSPPLQPV
jgi:protein required for attachment to host cells